MTEPIRLIIVPTEADPITSYYTLQGYTSSPTLKVSDSVTYKCYIRDIYGNEIIPSVFKLILFMIFHAKLKRFHLQKIIQQELFLKTFSILVFSK